MTYLNTLPDRQSTAQTEKAHEAEILNEAKGYSFPVDQWTRLNRFILLGSEGGTYYATEKDLLGQNLANTIDCIKTDGMRVIKTAVEISDQGRAIKNEPAILVLALALVHGDLVTKKLASNSVSKICRTGTHILHLAAYLNKLGGWGRGKRTALEGWYKAQKPSDLAYQVVKYQYRDSWSHKDVLRLIHPNPKQLTGLNGLDQVYTWIVKGVVPEAENLGIIRAFERAKTADKKTVIELIKSDNLSREMIPTMFHPDKDVQAALFEKSPLTALLRNLGNFSASGLFSDAAIRGVAVKRLTDLDALKKARIHPISLLIALKTYQNGKGFKGGNTWTAYTDIVNALDTAFYATFDNVTPTDKRIMVAVDVSGSMSSGQTANGNMSVSQAAAALALVIASTEPNAVIVTFDDEAKPTTLSKRQRLDDVMNRLGFRGGGTDCSSPINYARQRKQLFDAFIILTDSQTWSGHNHPFQALKSYRDEMKLGAGLITVACVDNGITITSPEDARSMDVAGFDTNTPTLINEFLTSFTKA